MATTDDATARDTVLDFHERVMTGKDLDAAEELLTPDYTEHNPAFPDGVIHGREEVAAFWADLFEAFPDLSVTEEDVLVDGDTVVTRNVGRGTHEGEFLGNPATGNEFTVAGISVYRLEDGRIAESWISLDLLGLVDQLGVTPDV